MRLLPSPRSLRTRWDVWRYRAPVWSLTVRGRAIKLVVASKIEHGRAYTYATKEPLTLDWIDAMDPSDVLWDVGANVGVYALYAAARGLRVVAIEAEASNVARLLANVAANSWQDRVSIVGAPLGDRVALQPLYLHSLEVGAALHNLGTPIDYKGEAFAPAATQWSMTTTIDALVAAGCFPAPAHLKIDVDGVEQQILDGAAHTLAATAALRSVLLEVARSREDSLSRTMDKHGFVVAKFERAGSGVDNCVFRRLHR